MPDKITKKIELDLSDVPRERRAELKEEIGDFVVNEILRNIADGQSPVSGEGRFKRLNKEYADRDKLGNTTPNLNNEGDLVESIVSKNTRDGIEVGVFRKSQVGKADGHNNFSGDSKLPRRRFIPDENQNFKRGIQAEINRMIEDAETDARRLTIEDSEESEESVTIGLQDIFSDESIIEALIRELNRGS